ncbi:beta-galactosidase family protein [Humibacter sp. RRB41]|uniref:glycoside hydrolase family 35 protein n=1 Tax=Humibacter sp. RRB41 TaxID=2919946 RepID=UPI001FAB1D2E|nr:beta-galactosidase family protein [Humibacter sp. RRB41]
MSSFGIAGDDFVLDGRPFRILSGAIHYFRVHPDHWADRVAKAKAMGLNTIETYVPWNFHEPEPGVWLESGRHDFARFIRIVAEAGMYLIVRPGPYICAEWDNGGLPAWLFRDAAVGIRENEPNFVAAVTAYLQRVLGIVAPQQIDRGGPVILVQVENEYGAYGDDHDYLRELTDVTRAAGITVPLTTVDQPTDAMLAAGTLPDLLTTGSFGSRAAERLTVLRRHQATGPLMCSEFWDGWFDDWGAHHHTTSVEQSAADLDELLAAGASVNIYMFHGGTNFGFTNGANDKGVYKPIVTSYDYDAPLSESGDPTAKFWAFREVIARYAPVPDEVPQVAQPAPELTASVDRVVPLRAVADRLGTEHHRDETPTLDELGHYGGFALYGTDIDLRADAVLSFAEVRDRAQVFLNDRPIGVLSRDHHESTLVVPAGSGRLTLLVEDQGRVDYGPRIGEPKGLIGPVTLGGEPLTGWDVRPLCLEELTVVLDAVTAAPTDADGVRGPAFVRAHFDLDTEPSSIPGLFLDTSGWGKGIAWVNGFNLGRYWSRGPQSTLFVPGPVLRRDGNEVILFELNSSSRTSVAFVPRAQLGHTEA